jgi:hypothetical protein
VRPLAILALSLLVALPVTACGSSAPSSASLTGTARQQDCTAVSDVLSNGPDPDADPVGYAEAQVLPLRQLTLSDPALRPAVHTLAAAYQALSASHGAPADAVKVSAAEHAVNAICPGAAP